MDEKQKAREEAQARQRAITDAWKRVATEMPVLLEDFTEFCDGIAATYRRFADEEEHLGVPIDDHKIASFLRQAKVCDMVKTYITSRLD